MRLRLAESRAREEASVAKSKALEETRKYSFAGRPEPSQWYPRG